jgi:hypothetical protein
MRAVKTTVGVALLGLTLAGCYDVAAEIERARQHLAHHQELEARLAATEARLRELEAEMAVVKERLTAGLVAARVVVYRPTKALTASGRRGAGPGSPAR